MRLLVILMLLFVFPISAFCQHFFSDNKSNIGIGDSLLILDLTNKSGRILYENPDSSMFYAQNALLLSNEKRFEYGQYRSQIEISKVLWVIGSYAESHRSFLKLLEQARDENVSFRISECLAWLVVVCRDWGNYDEGLKYFEESENYRESFPQHVWNMNKASIYVLQGRFEEAISLLDENAESYLDFMLLIKGNAFLGTGSTQKAKEYFYRALQLLKVDPNSKNLADTYRGISSAFKAENKIDSSIYYAEKSYLINRTSFKRGYYHSCILLSQIYEDRNPSKSIKYLNEAVIANNEMRNTQQVLTSLNSFYSEKIDQIKIKQEKKLIEIEYRQWGMIGGLFSLLIILILLYISRRNHLRSKVKIENAYKKLQATQSQLIQSEKMASLGELTAGIAHEIQNPLNFVNNFSEVNSELVEELKEEIKKGDLKEIEAIAKDIEENESKIKHHGHRADSIVKGMLMHSRASSGEKELTDINALADEYLRLAYYGMRAKDKSFNAAFKTDFDASLPKINVVPQDIGRILLNLINNAFHAVHEKANRHSESEHRDDVEPADYKPEVMVNTKQVDGKVQIVVSDNGPGIPEGIRDKIFQPFFTTKPTGSGTGLGLSLSYDIVKAHGGEIYLINPESTGCCIKLLLPFK